jgi:hypothetical protein
VLWRPVCTGLDIALAQPHLVGQSAGAAQRMAGKAARTKANDLRPALAAKELRMKKKSRWGPGAPAMQVLHEIKSIVREAQLVPPKLAEQQTAAAAAAASAAVARQLQECEEPPRAGLHLGACTCRCRTLLRGPCGAAAQHAALRGRGRGRGVSRHRPLGSSASGLRCRC